MQMINYELVLERLDKIEGFMISNIIKQSYNAETSEISIEFIDNNGVNHTISSVNYVPHNKVAIEITAECIICHDRETRVIDDLNDLKVICKYHSKNITSFDKIEALIDEFQSTKDFFIIINAVNKNNPFSTCEICSYHRPYKKAT